MLNSIILKKNTKGGKSLMCHFLARTPFVLFSSTQIFGVNVAMVQLFSKNPIYSYAYKEYISKIYFLDLDYIIAVSVFLGEICRITGYHQKQYQVRHQGFVLRFKKHALVGLSTSFFQQLQKTSNKCVLQWFVEQREFTKVNICEIKMRY